MQQCLHFSPLFSSSFEKKNTGILLCKTKTTVVDIEDVEQSELIDSLLDVPIPEDVDDSQGADRSDEHVDESLEPLRRELRKILIGLRENLSLTSKSVSVVADKMAEVVELPQQGWIKETTKLFSNNDSISKLYLDCLMQKVPVFCEVLHNLNSQRKLERFVSQELLDIAPTEFI